MALTVVHLSITPLAGGPFRLVSVLRRQTDLNVRLIDLKRWGAYPQDIIFEESRDEAVELIHAADILHLHNYIDLRSHGFVPVDLEALHRAGKSILRQFRTASATLALKTGLPEETIVSAAIPSIVIAQYPERYYPNALVVPNSVPSEVPEYRYHGEPITHDICYSPSGMVPAWSSRWDTKGAPETILMLKEVQARSHSRNLIISGRPLSEVMAHKRASKIIIDDLVTGSYHASGLEGLCLGKAVLCHLDPRTERVLKEITGCETPPFMNVRLENAREVLVDLLSRDELIGSMGQANRIWIDSYWSERIIADRYRGVYETLLKDPSLIRRQDGLRLDGALRRYWAMDLPDVVYRARVGRSRAGLSMKARAGLMCRQARTAIKRTITACAPDRVLKWWRDRRSIVRD